jgi:hypothetical protein
MLQYIRFYEAQGLRNALVEARANEGRMPSAGQIIWKASFIKPTAKARKLHVIAPKPTKI